jgi:hypothetical protein
MGWDLDPRMWDDAWFRPLGLAAQGLWQLCLQSRIRTTLPGMVVAGEATLSETWGKPIEVVRQGLRELVLPDDSGKQHFFFDPISRVIRIPNAPKYRKADNPNVLSSWYRNWREVPECQLKWDHLKSLRDGVNMQNQTMRETWEDTFGVIIRAHESGVQLRTNAELPPTHRPRRRRDPDPIPNPTPIPIPTPDPIPTPTVTSTVSSTVSETVSEPRNLLDFKKKSQTGGRPERRISTTPVPGTVVPSGLTGANWGVPNGTSGANGRQLANVSSPAEIIQQPTNESPQDPNLPPVNRTKGGNILPPGWE